MREGVAMKWRKLVVVPFLAAACSNLEGLSGGPSGSPGDAGPNLDAAAATNTDGAADAGDGGCPRGVGPSMIAITSLVGARICIDATEVTQAQYQAFLQAAGTDTTGLGALCDFTTSFAPTSCGTYDPKATPDLPVTCVTWCQARAFCKWNGKRLCGRIGGGALDPSMFFDPTKDQWFAACSDNGSPSHVFPYGATYSGAACNTSDNEAGAGKPWAAGTVASCQGGVPGLFDMSGNAAEWQDLCLEKEAGASAGECALRGGSFAHGAVDVAAVKCGNAGDGYVYAARTVQANDIGFRCCAD